MISKIKKLVLEKVLLKNQMTDPAAEAILGHRSAASLATGPVI